MDARERRNIDFQAINENYHCKHDILTMISNELEIIMASQSQILKLLTVKIKKKPG